MHERGRMCRRTAAFEGEDPAKLSPEHEFASRQILFQELLKSVGNFGAVRVIGMCYQTRICKIAFGHLQVVSMEFPPFEIGRFVLIDKQFCPAGFPAILHVTGPGIGDGASRHRLPDAFDL